MKYAVLIDASSFEEKVWNDYQDDYYADKPLDYDIPVLKTKEQYLQLKNTAGLLLRDLSNKGIPIWAESVYIAKDSLILYSLHEDCESAVDVVNELGSKNIESHWILGQYAMC